MSNYLTYSHKSDDKTPKTRYKQLACDALPSWAVDVEDVEEPEPKLVYMILFVKSGEFNYFEEIEGDVIYSSKEQVENEVKLLNEKHIKEFPYNSGAFEIKEMSLV